MPAELTPFVEPPSVVMPPSLWTCLKAEFQRRWWHGLAAGGAGAAIVLLLGAVGQDPFTVGVAGLLGVVGGSVLGAYSAPWGRAGRLTWNPEATWKERARRNAAAYAVGLWNSLLLIAALTAATLPFAGFGVLDLTRPAGLTETVLIVASTTLVAWFAGFVWMTCTAALYASMGLGFLSTLLIFAAVYELAPGDLFDRGLRSVPLAWIVLASAVVFGWGGLQYWAGVGRPKERPTRRRAVLPAVVCLLALVAGFGCQAALVWAYIPRTSDIAWYDELRPAPDGRHVAVLAHGMVRQPPAAVTRILGNPVDVQSCATWMIIDAADRSQRPVSGFSWWQLGWSPDGRYFGYRMEMTRTRLFLESLLPRHFRDRAGPNAPGPIYRFDTRTGSSALVSQGEGDFLGWADNSHLRFLDFRTASDSLELAIRDVDVETFQETSRSVVIQGRSPAIADHYGAKAVAVMTGPMSVGRCRPRPEEIVLVNLDTGAVIRRPARVEGGNADARVLGPDAVVVSAYGWLDAQSRPTTEPAEGPMHVMDSRLIAMGSGRETSLRGSETAGVLDSWEPSVRSRLTRRWALVTRESTSLGAPLIGLLDVESGRVYSRPDWPAGGGRSWACSSPGGQDLLVLTLAGAGASGFTLSLESPEGPFVAHSLTAPADVRVSPPRNWLQVGWITDREIVFLSQERHLVFYDVVEKRRTRIVTIK